MQDEKYRLFISLIKKPSHVQKGFFQIILTDKIIDTYVDSGSKSSITNMWFSLLI